MEQMRLSLKEPRGRWPCACSGSNRDCAPMHIGAGPQWRMRLRCQEAWRGPLVMSLWVVSLWARTARPLVPTWA